MSNNQPASDPSRFLKRHWSRLTQAAVWLLAVLSGFLNQPPGLTPADDDRKIVPFAGFLVAAIVGLSSLPLHKWGSRSHAWRWWAAGAVFLTLGVAVFFTYDYYMGRWTSPYNDQGVVIGTKWTRIGKAAQQGNYESIEAMLEEFGGESPVLWELGELEERRRILAFIYAGCVTVSALTIITIVQAIHCHSGESGPPADHS